MRTPAIDEETCPVRHTHTHTHTHTCPSMCLIHNNANLCTVISLSVNARNSVLHNGSSASEQRNYCSGLWTSQKYFIHYKCITIYRLVLRKKLEVY